MCDNYNPAIYPYKRAHLFDISNGEGILREDWTYQDKDSPAIAEPVSVQCRNGRCKFFLKCDDVDSFTRQVIYHFEKSKLHKRNMKSININNGQ
jgi:hypothetical protein